MAIIRLLKALSASRLLSVHNSWLLVRALKENGVNPAALLGFAAKKYPQQIALVMGQEQYTYEALYANSMQKACLLHTKYGLSNNMKVAVQCRNRVELVQTIFALSRLGVDIYFLHSDMTHSNRRQLSKQHRFDLIIVDGSTSSDVDSLKFVHISSLTKFSQPVTLPKTSSTQLILLTSGTTGVPKAVKHEPSLFHYLHPFIAMLERLKLADTNCGYIATPIYHGYGLAILMLFIVLGKKMVLLERFEPHLACSLIAKHNVDVVTCVPLMLQRMLDEDADSLRSLCCIASGGAPLNPELVQRVQRQLGPVLYNLYGTSETGLNIIATPDDLWHAPNTIGKSIKGINVKLVHTNERHVGQLYVKSEAGMKSAKQQWTGTGDLASYKEGLYFLAGRMDDLVISGGVNVYPVQLEQALRTHPSIQDTVVVGVEDEQFGQRLLAFVELKPGEIVPQPALLAWLKSRVARYEMPREVKYVDRIPYTSLGKPDKKSLVI